MEEEFFDLSFEDVNKLDILNLPDEAKNDEESEQEKTDKTEEKPDEIKSDKVEKEDDEQGEENPTESNDEGSPNISSSIAFTLADNGVLQTLDKERLGKINTTEDLIEAFEEDINSRVEERLTEQQKRVLDALNTGVTPSVVQQYEQVLDTLNKVTDETLEAEGEQYENYRKSLIYQDYINKGFEEDDAKEMVERSVENGKDVDDAKKALNSMKKFYQKSYETEIENNKAEHKKYIDAQKKQIEDLQKSILEDDDFYNPLEVNKTLRKKIFDTVSKPIEQKDGVQVTELQKYMKEKPNEALKMFGTLYVLTEGFTKFEGIFNAAVKKKVRESTKNLAKLLSQTGKVDGSLQFKSGVNEDSNLRIVDFDF